MKKFLTIAGVFAFILFIPYMVMYPNIKKNRLKHHLEAEYSQYMRDYSTLSADSNEEYLLKSHDIYMGLCNVLISAAANTECNDIMKKTDVILTEILKQQVMAIRSVPDILKQKHYIDTILTPEMEMMHKVGDIYEKEMMKALKSVYGIPSGPQTFKQMKKD